MKFYRYEDMLMDWDYRFNQPGRVSIYLIEFELINETTKGYWISKYPSKEYSISNKRIPMVLSPISEESIIEKRWISKESRKKYAYPTKEEALSGFIARKNRQITILDRKLKQARVARSLAIEERSRKNEMSPMQ